MTDVSVGFRRPCWWPCSADGHQHGVSIQISIHLGKTFLRILSCLRKIAATLSPSFEFAVASSLFALPSIPRALPFLSSPQACGQETYTVKAARKRPLRREAATWIFAYLPFFFSGLYLLNGFDFYFDLFWMVWHWKPAITDLFWWSYPAVWDPWILRSSMLWWAETETKHKAERERLVNILFLY